MLRLRGLRGDRLLQALSTHFDLSETKVGANGQVQTRLYEKFGFCIREQVRLSPGENEPATAPQIAPQAPLAEPVEERPTAERDRLLEALSADFDLSETRVTANGRVQTRSYEKYGLHIQERIQLPPPEDQRYLPVANGLNGSNGSHGDAPHGPANGSSNGLLKLAGAMKEAERLPAPAPEIAPPVSLAGSIRRSLVELRELLSGEDPGASSVEPIEEDAAEAAEHQETSLSPPPALYSVLANKRIALIGFSRSEMQIARRGFEDQGSQVMPVDWSELERAIPMLTIRDLMVIRLEPDEDGRRLDVLASVNRPTLLAGDSECLIQLDPEHSGAPFDFVAPPFPAEEVVWRAANLLTRAAGSGEPAPVAQDPPEQEERKTVRVLIAENDPATATLLETVLSSQGMECYVARNGEDALETARSIQVDASILEVGLPGLDGFQILAALKRDPETAKVRVMFLTARQSEADILRAFGLGADDYIIKPFSPMEVCARLKRLLGRAF